MCMDGGFFHLLVPDALPEGWVWKCHFPIQACFWERAQRRGEQVPLSIAMKKESAAAPRDDNLGTKSAANIAPQRPQPRISNQHMARSASEASARDALFHVGGTYIGKRGIHRHKNKSVAVVSFKAQAKSRQRHGISSRRAMTCASNMTACFSTASSTPSRVCKCSVWRHLLLEAWQQLVMSQPCHFKIFQICKNSLVRRGSPL